MFYNRADGGRFKIVDGQVVWCYLIVTCKAFYECPMIGYHPEYSSGTQRQFGDNSYERCSTVMGGYSRIDRASILFTGIACQRTSICKLQLTRVLPSQGHKCGEGRPLMIQLAGSRSEYMVSCLLNIISVRFGMCVKREPRVLPSH